MILHHVGYLVSSIDKVIRETSIFPIIKSKSDIHYDSNQDVYIMFIWSSEEKNTCVELVEPGVENYSLRNQLKKKGDHLYHVCYETKCFDRELTIFKKNGAIIVKNPIPAVAFENREVVFLYLRQGLLIELLRS